jgi:heme/copper-type cytochrome/quinol oxidase subunit 2
MLSNLGEIAVSVVFLLLLVMKLDPFDLLMPTRVQMIIICLVVAAFGLYSAVLFRQKARDEREAQHLYRASHFAYIGGTAILVAAITVQSFLGQTDPWLFGILAAMVIIKMVTLIWSRMKN